MSEEGIRRYYRGRMRRLEAKHREALREIYGTNLKLRADYSALLMRLGETHALLTPKQRAKIVSLQIPLAQGENVKTYERLSTVKDNGEKITAGAKRGGGTRGKLRTKFLPRAAQRAIRQRVRYAR